MLKLIKLAHTSIWAVMAAATLYIFYAGIMNKVNLLLWISIALILLETAILLFNRWTCPLTPLAKRYTDDRKDNFDIYLPEWLARHNKTIFGAKFVLGLILTAINLIRRS